MKNVLKSMAAASIILAAGFAQAQSVSLSGLDREATPNVAAGSTAINIDQDWETPSDCLGYLQAVTLSVPAGFTAFGRTYGSTPTWSIAWGNPPSDCGLAPTGAAEAFGSGFRVIYDWGTTSFSGSVSSGTGAWTSAKLVVVVDATFAPLSINLVTKTGSDELVYDLHP